ncbi:MAG: hypothetical protein R6U56_08530 [Opitutales bacterium]
MAPSYDALFGAIFADDDGDGLPNWWESEFFGSNTAADPNADEPDGDGLTNLEEYELGSDPTKVS